MTKFSKRICALTTLTTCLALSAPAIADEVETKGELLTAIEASKPLFNARLAYENVDEDAAPETADALTYRFRVGVETGAAYGTSLLVEFDHVEDLIGDFNSTTNGLGMYPVVADPNVTELNRLQLTNKSLPDTVATLGRQRIILDDARFVGNVGWRQNEQTYDAIRFQNTSLGDLAIDVAYISRINRIFGDESAMGKFEGDTTLLNASYPTPLGKLTGFAYFVDTEEAPALSSDTYGARLSGSQEVGPGSLAYALSYATQTDGGSNTTDYDADYYLVEGTYAVNGFTGGLGLEVLGGDTAGSFKTPLATGHKFQGWADKFLVTPLDGVEDIYAKVGYAPGKVGPFEGVKLLAVYHDFSADIGGDDYGSELDLLVGAKWKQLGLTLKYADYSADTLSSDTQKIWLRVDYGF